MTQSSAPASFRAMRGRCVSVLGSNHGEGAHTGGCAEGGGDGGEDADDDLDDEEQVELPLFTKCLAPIIVSMRGFLSYVKSYVCICIFFVNGRGTYSDSINSSQSLLLPFRPKTLA